MSQKVSPILFNNYIYNSSKWFNKTNNKFILNEDLQIRELITIIFKQNIANQFLFIDKIVIYKYVSKINIFIYFFCNFKSLKQNLIMSKFYKNKQYINIYYLFYKYLEILDIKKIEILKILSVLKYKTDNIHIYLKNITYNFNSVINVHKRIILKKNYEFYNYLKINKYKYYLYQNNNNNNVNFILKNRNIHYFIKKQQKNLLKRYITLRYYKSLRFIIYSLCYNEFFLNKLDISSLINIIYFELNSIDNASKNFNFIFYNIFNVIRDCLNYYFKDKNCKINGLRIQIKGRFMLTKRKRIFIFNFGNLNLNKIDIAKDYSCLNLVKSTGSSSIKIWINYKN